MENIKFGPRIRSDFQNQNWIEFFLKKSLEKSVSGNMVKGLMVEAMVKGFEFPSQADL